MLAGGDVAMAQRKKPLWQLCNGRDWAVVQQRIRDKDVGDINTKDDVVSFHAMLATFMQTRSVENVIEIMGEIEAEVSELLQRRSVKTEAIFAGEK